MFCKYASYTYQFECAVSLKVRLCRCVLCYVKSRNDSEYLSTFGSKKIGYLTNPNLKRKFIQKEQHSVERITPPGWTVYIWYPTKRSDLDPNLNQSLIGLFLSPTNSSTKFCHNSSTTFWDIVLCIVFGPISQWWRITKKTYNTWIWIFTKSNQFVLATHLTCPTNSVRICPQLFQISCSQSSRQTKRPWWRHNLHP